MARVRHVPNQVLDESLARRMLLQRAVDALLRFLKLLRH
jgi:hypothetical protein